MFPPARSFPQCRGGWRVVRGVLRDFGRGVALGQRRGGGSRTHLFPSYQQLAGKRGILRGRGEDTSVEPGTLIMSFLGSGDRSASQQSM